MDISRFNGLCLDADCYDLRRNVMIKPLLSDEEGVPVGLTVEYC